MKAFLPQMGDRYAENRNFDRGPGAHRDVSGLSPYIRRRLVLESDVVAAAISAHGFESSEKFVQEVMWRGYFKGWLGSGLIDQIQKMTVAAMQMADMKVWAQRS